MSSLPGVIVTRTGTGSGCLGVTIYRRSHGCPIIEEPDADRSNASEIFTALQTPVRAAAALTKSSPVGDRAYGCRVFAGQLRLGQQATEAPRKIFC